MSNDKFSYPRGSEWRKWDLHVHTPASALEHSLGSNWNVYIEKLIEAANKHKIEAIATADYFTIEGYRQLLRYYDPTKRILGIGGKTAPVYPIPGVELRLDNFNSDSESINIHIFFDPELCSPDFIESNFLEGLRIAYQGHDYPLKKQNLLAIGKSISENSPINPGQDFSSLDERTQKQYIQKALGVITLNKKDINEALKDIDEIFERQAMPSRAYLIAIVGKGHGGIQDLKWFEDNKQFSRSGLIREDLTHQADIIFSNTPDDRRFYLGKKEDTPPEEIEIRFKNAKPCVWGSDSDSLETLLHPSNGNSNDYTWIKANAVFEGLRQIIHEPELRVKVQKDSPTETETYARIANCSINFPPNLEIKNSESEEKTKFCLQGKYAFCLSNNLTSIIGGRGSGKSTLIHLLYNKQINKELDRLDDVNSPLLNLDLGRDPLKKVADLTETDVPSATEFFLQNEIEKFARDIRSMSELIRHRLNRLSSLDEAKESLKELQEKWESEEREMDALIQAYDQISNSNKETANLRKDIDTLKKQTNVIKSKDYKILKEETEDISNTISAFNRYQREYEELIESIDSLVEEIKQLDWDQFNSQKSLETTTSKLGDSKKELKSSFEQAKAKYEKVNYPEQLEAKKLELKKYLKGKGLSPENIEELADAAEQINELTRRIRLLERKRQPYEQVYSKKEETFENYKKAYNDYKERFFEATDTLENSLARLPFSDKKKSRTEITFRPKLNEQSLKDTVTDFIKENVQSKGLSKDNIQNVLFSGDKLSDFAESKEAIKDAVDSSQIAEIHTKVLRECVSDDDFLEKLQLRIRRYYFDISNIQVQTKLGDKLLQNTSFGERCGIVVAIALTAGTNPIVIDQPEDNLDGKFVSKVLVHLLRKQKQNRQIILITRDANIVIGGDSELILILDTNNGKAELIPSTIEDRSTREKYIWILDGGKKAFQQRERKYSIHKS